ncbi:11278_t:CDS:2, partial [Scutellospora calospora]
QKSQVEQKGKSSLDFDFQSTLLFDPSMSALPIILKQNSDNGAKLPIAGLWLNASKSESMLE